MPYRICKRFEIENGHMLSKHPDNCKFPHGHSRLVEIVLTAETLDENDMVCDFKVLKSTIKEFLESWDHAMAMNTQDPHFVTLRQAYGDRVIPFENQDPTTEVMVFRLFQELKTRLQEYTREPSPRYPLRAEVRLLRVRLGETSSSWAEYEE
jgi:6-pyruvoyltetrahydropterin/6-carboxytetrahydropterin synthase